MNTQIKLPGGGYLNPKWDWSLHGIFWGALLRLVVLVILFVHVLLFVPRLVRKWLRS